MGDTFINWKRFTGYLAAVTCASLLVASATTEQAKLNEELAKKLQIVHQPGPDVLNVEVAVTDVEAATPALRSISMAVPQARLLATLKRGVSGSWRRGDAENAMREWANLLAERLSVSTTGAAKSSGAES